MKWARPRCECCSAGSSTCCAWRVGVVSALHSALSFGPWCVQCPSLAVKITRSPSGRHPADWDAEQVANFVSGLRINCPTSAAGITGAELLLLTPGDVVQRMQCQEEQARLVCSEVQRIAQEQAGGGPGAAPATADPLQGPADGAEEKGQGESEEAAEEEKKEDEDLTAEEAEAELNLQRYVKLQQRIAELHGMQIKSQLFKVQRRVSALEQELDSMVQLLESSRQAMAKAHEAYNKLGKGSWYPGKLILNNTDAKLAAAGSELERAHEELLQREQQKAEITSKLRDSSRRFLLWKTQEAELEAVLSEAAELEAAMFASPTAEGSQGKMNVVDTLCALQDEGAQAARELQEDEQEEEEARQGVAAAAAAEGQGQQKAALFGGRVLSVLADKMGKVDLSKHKDRFGGWGRGRLLRITADKLQRAAEARRQEREAGMRRVQGGISACGGSKAQEVDASLQHLFPEPACSFNPAYHCPPSAFLWPYSHRFMGKLQRLQTGSVLQAFYRFGPFDVDPEHPSRLLPAERGTAPPLFLLSGLGSTMIAWGTPLLRALATSHEVIIMEYRGAGLSKDLSGQPWNYYNQAEAVLLLADALGIPKFNWLGWSSGGNTGLVLAALYGDRLGRMASHAGMAGGPETIVPPAYEMLDPDLSLSVGQTMALIFPPDDPADFKATCAEYIKAVFSMPGAITDQTVGPKAAQEQWHADQEFIRRDGRVWDALPGVRVPCLIMNGDKDVLVPHENAVRIAQRVPGARLHTWKGWGHGFKDSVHFAEVVNDFLLAHQ